jgi:hypothetical protein
VAIAGSIVAHASGQIASAATTCSQTHRISTAAGTNIAPVI